MRTRNEIINDLNQVENWLSPENLYADGERSHSAAQKLARQLNNERRRLITELKALPIVHITNVPAF